MRKLVLLAAVLTLAFAPAPLPKRAAVPTEPNVHGDWKVVSVFAADVVLALDTVRFAPHKLEAYHDGKLCFRWYTTYDPADRPARVDLRDAKSGGRVRLGIYKVDGDEMTICYAQKGRFRPTEFHSFDQFEIVLKRK